MLIIKFNRVQWVKRIKKWVLTVYRWWLVFSKYGRSAVDDITFPFPISFKYKIKHVKRLRKEKTFGIKIRPTCVRGDTKRRMKETVELMDIMNEWMKLGHSSRNKMHLKLIEKAKKNIKKQQSIKYNKCKMST